MPKQIPDSQVLDAAVEVMAARGYSAATSKQIAETAGINEVTLFRRFGNKSNLLRAAMLAELERFEDEECWRYTGDLEEDLQRVVRFYVGLLARKHRLIPTILAEFPRQPELAEVIEIPQRIVKSVAKLIIKYQQDGKLVKDNPIHMVAGLLSPLLLGTMLQQSSGNTIPFDPIDPVKHVKTFLHGRIE